MLDPQELRRDFAFFREPSDQPVTYLDNAATTQIADTVLEAMTDFYRQGAANVHRAGHHLGTLATSRFEHARIQVQRFINAASPTEVIWTSGTTSAINLLASSLSLSLGPGDEIILSAMEHHSNLVPWQLAARKHGFGLRYVPVTPEGELDLMSYAALLSPRTRLVSLCHVSNALGTVNPVSELVQLAHAAGAKVLLDGAQAVAHVAVNVQALDVDFYAFSGHKMYGPSGIGVLYGKQTELMQLPPWQGGGEMISTVSLEGSTFREPPLRFEAGTPPIAQAIGLGAACGYLSRLPRETLQEQEQKLLAQLKQGLRQVKGVRLVGAAREQVACVSFVAEGAHNSDLAMLLDEQGFAVRCGHHCTMPLMQQLNLGGTVRASLALYNTQEEVTAFIQAVAHSLDLLT